MAELPQNATEQHTSDAPAPGTHTSSHRAHIYLGPAGFSYKDWDGIVYPPALKKAMHPVEYLAQYFNCIEINTSFYGHIRPEHGKLWCLKAKAVNPDFQFTAKLNRAFTHAPASAIQSTSALTLRPTDEDEKLAKEGLDSVAEQEMLGALLIQFPISFKNENRNRDYLNDVLLKFRQYPCVVEVRHESWNNENILRYFMDWGIAFCNIDQPLLGKSIGHTQHVTSKVGYVRLHGRNYKEWFDSTSRDDRYNYLYKKPELEGWKGKIEGVAEKTERTFVITNNHYQGKAAVNALQLKSMLSGKRVKVPETLENRYPELSEIAE